MASLLKQYEFKDYMLGEFKSKKQSLKKHHSKKIKRWEK